MSKQNKRHYREGSSTDELLTWLQERPRSFGWDAIFAYNRASANTLLMDQQLERLAADNASDLIYMDATIKGENAYTEHLFGICLGVPRLSFENTDIEHASVRLALQVYDGLSLSVATPVGAIGGIHGIQRPSALAGPTLWMELGLINSAPDKAGNVGTVALDLQEMEINSFKTNLLSDELGRHNAAVFFKSWFAALPPGQRLYSLGAVNYELGAALAPKRFHIRTQPAPAAQTAARNDGDGAIVLFMTLENGTDGVIPPADAFNYLIPDDSNGALYSNTLLLSNDMLFGLIETAVNAQLPVVQYERIRTFDEMGNPSHLYLHAVSGEINWQDFTFSSVYQDSQSLMTCKRISLETANPLYPGHTLKAGNNTLIIEWDTTAHPFFHQTVRLSNADEIERSGEMDFSVHAHVETKAVVLSNASVQFENNASAIKETTLSSPDWAYAFDENNREQLHEALGAKTDAAFFEVMQEVPLPGIDAFTTRYLVFPDKKLMHTAMFMPGDLVLFGSLAAYPETASVSPRELIITAGEAYHFLIEPKPEGRVEWGLRGLDGDDDPARIGTVNADGIYQAPVRQNFKTHSTQAILEATVILDQRLYFSHALISIVKNGVQVNPSFRVVAPNQSIDFTAGSVSDASLVWTIVDPSQGAVLAPAISEAGGFTYTAGPPRSGALFTLDVVRVRDNTLIEAALAHVLVINGLLTGEVGVDLGTSPNRQATLSFSYQGNNGPVIVPPESVTWTLLAGAGQIVDGVYTEPETLDLGFALITGQYPISDHYTIRGFTVLPLPLNEYPDLGRAFQQASMSPAEPRKKS